MKRTRPAFTLVEMLTSCIILSLLMVALGYGLKLAPLSTGAGATYAQSSLEAIDVVERVSDDLNVAMNFTEKTSKAVKFTVPDRDGDLSPDTIRYEWFPTAGTITIPGAGGGTAPGGLLGALVGISGENAGGDLNISVPAYTLTRQVNNGTPSVLGRDVRSFGLSYLYRSMSPPPATTVEDAQLWAINPVLGTSRDGSINATSWFSATFLPSAQLPAGKTSFTITRVSLYMKSDASNEGLFRVSVRPAQVSNTPSPSILETSVAVPEISLGDTYEWVEFPFTTLTNLTPSTKYSIVVQHMAGGSGTFGTVNWMQSVLSGPGSTWFSSSTTGGSTWTAATTSNYLKFRIYGTASP